MKTVIQVLKEEREKLAELIATGNYDMLKEYLVKIEEKIAILEARFMTEAEKVKDEGRF